VSVVSERLGNWFPVLVAAALPTLFLTNLVDAYILPRAAVVIAGACLGAGLALLTRGNRGLGGLRWPLAAAAAAGLLAFAFSVSWPLSLIGSYTRYESLPMRVAYLGLLAMPVWLLRTQAARTAVIAALIAGTTVASVMAISQLHAPFRPDGNLGNANLLGVLIAMALPLCLVQMVRLNWFTTFAWMFAALMVGGLIVSTSRSGALAALAGCAAVGVFRLRRWAAVIAGGAATALVVAGLLSIVVGPLRDLNGDPGPTRIHLYPDAARMVEARPLTGWGEDATGLVFGRYLSGDWSPGVTFDRAHSGPLDEAATQGLVGLGALGWVLVVLFRGLWRWRFVRLELTVGGHRLASFSVGAIAAACVAYSVWVLFNFDWAPATGVFWLLAGLGWSAVRAQAGQDVPEPPQQVQQVGRLAGALALVLVAIAFAVMPVLAEAWYAQGRSDLAVRADPLQSQYHRALGEELIAQGSHSEGLAELRLAANLGATDPALYVELGDEDLHAGNVAQARADYRMALTIDPYWAPARQRLAGSGGLAAA
jgi:O-antigen ligase